MKKLLLIAIITITANAGGIWDMIKNSQSDGTLKTKQYTIKVSGVDTRGYVLMVPEMKSICFITYSSHGIPAMSCKTQKEIKGK